MRFIMALLVIGSWTTAVWAKTIKVPKGAIEVNQLHEELLVAFPTWRGTPQPDGTLANPLLQVESTDQEVLLTVPETTADASVQAVLKAHKPQPKRDKAAEEKAKKPSSLTLEERVKRIEVVLGID